MSTAPSSTQTHVIPSRTVAANPNAVENPLIVADVVAYLNATARLLQEEAHEQHDLKADFDWFMSGQVNTKAFQGKYVAVWEKKIAGVGATELEAERIAKFHYGSNCTAVVIYVPEDDVSEEEKQQVEQSRRDIAEGKAKRYKNAEEYLKSIDEESE